MARAIIGLAANADAAAVKKALTAAGAESLSGPVPELPDVIVATVSATHDLDAFLQHVRTVPGVRYAEADAMRSTY